MSTNLRQEMNELFGSPKQEAEQHSERYRTARNRFGTNGVASLIERQYDTERQAVATQTGMESRDDDQDNYETWTRTQTQRFRKGEGPELG